MKNDQKNSDPKTYTANVMLGDCTLEIDDFDSLEACAKYATYHHNNNGAIGYRVDVAGEMVARFFAGHAGWVDCDAPENRAARRAAKKPRRRSAPGDRCLRGIGRALTPKAPRADRDSGVAPLDQATAAGLGQALSAPETASPHRPREISAFIDAPATILGGKSVEARASGVTAAACDGFPPSTSADGVTHGRFRPGDAMIPALPASAVNDSLDELTGNNWRGVRQYVRADHALKQYVETTVANLATGVIREILAILKETLDAIAPASLSADECNRLWLAHLDTAMAPIMSKTSCAGSRLLRDSWELSGELGSVVDASIDDAIIDSAASTPYPEDAHFEQRKAILTQDLWGRHDLGKKRREIGEPK